ncbi:MAG: CPBP family intramembrane metalloprotease [Ruminococcaceae bacterium]|nr:CPBP family intramembrane metalloprotease [Oscillospiraceae bacterium]
MNDNYYNNDNREDGEQKEEIRFNEWEMNGSSNSYAWSGGGNNKGNGQYESYEPPTLIDEKKEKNHFSRIGFGYAMFTLVSTVAALLIQIVVLAINKDFYYSTLFLNIVTPVALYVFALPILLIIISSVEVKKPPKRKMGVGQWLVFLLIGFGVMYIGAFVGNFVMDYLSQMVGFDYSNSLDSIIDEENIWITAIFTVIVAPVGEELVFRKLIIDRTQKYGGAVCILLSAIVFGLMHGNFYQFFYCVGLGIILGYMYHSTGRVLPCILLHSAINFVGSVVPTWLSPALEGLEALDGGDVDAMMQFMMDNIGAIIGSFVFSLFVYVAMALAVILPIVLRKRIRLSPPEVALPRKRRVSIIVANAGILVMIAVYALEFGLSLIPG